MTREEIIEKTKDISEELTDLINEPFLERDDCYEAFIHLYSAVEKLYQARRVVLAAVPNEDAPEEEIVS